MGKVQIIKASAGSGKTFRLALEYVTRVLSENNPRPEKYRHILAVTFTNKATEEMKRRIIEELAKLAECKESEFSKKVCANLNIPINEAARRAKIVLTKILHDYTHFTVLTIDKFFQRIVRSFTHELGQDINYTVELQSSQIVERAVDMLFDETEKNADFKSWLSEYIGERIADNKSWNPRSEFIKLGEELFKQSESNTKTLTKSIIKNQIDCLEADIRALKKGIQELADELLKNISSTGVTPPTDFFRGATGFMSYFVKIAGGNISAPTDSVLKTVVEGTNWVKKDSPYKGTVESNLTIWQEKMLEIIENVKPILKIEQTHKVVKQNYRTFAVLPDIRETLDRYCQENSILPIADTNKIIEGLVNNNDAPFIYEKTGNTFTDYMLDEFQDTSAEQWKNFRPLIDNAVSQSNQCNVLLVGDVKQSIYRWRGGDWSLLASQVEQQFDTISEPLEENHRSEDIVIQFNNKLIGSNLKGTESDPNPLGINSVLNSMLNEALEQGSITEQLHTELTDITDNAYRGHEQRLPSTKSLGGGYVSVCCRDEQQTEDESDNGIGYVISCIEDAQRRGFKASQIAILVRKNGEANEVATALLKYKSEHPESPFVYDIVTQEALLLKHSPAVKFVIATFSYMNDSEDLVSREIFYEFSKFDESQCDALFSKLRKMTPIKAIDAIIGAVPELVQPQHIPYIQALHDNIIGFSTRNTPDTAEFLKWWSDNCDKMSITVSGEQNAINILTIHKSKGLQYKVVIIPFCNWQVTPMTNSIIWSQADDTQAHNLGKVPVSFNSAMAQSHYSEDYYREMVSSYIDNLNLLYVAITRAEAELYMMLPMESSKNRMSAFITQAFKQDDEGVSIGSLRGNIDVRGNDIVYEFGTKYSAEDESESESKEKKIVKLNVDTYPTIDSAKKVKISATTEYLLDKEGVRHTPRYYGNLMHSLLEHINHYSELDCAVADFVSKGKISERDGQRIKQMLEKALNTPLAREWFSEQWSTIRSEINIISPYSDNLQRPDRVMIQGNSAVVVDYKFGSDVKMHKQYTEKVSDYMKSLREMGYSDVRGYIWYVVLGSISEVKLLD